MGRSVCCNESAQTAWRACTQHDGLHATATAVAVACATWHARASRVRSDAKRTNRTHDDETPFVYSIPHEISDRTTIHTVHGVTIMTSMISMPVPSPSLHPPDAQINPTMPTGAPRAWPERRYNPAASRTSRADGMATAPPPLAPPPPPHACMPACTRPSHHDHH